jgi:hypothetical protein
MSFKKDPLLAILFYLIWGITLLHAYAEFHSWYWVYRNFDVLMHFLGGMWLGFFVLRFGTQVPFLRKVSDGKRVILGGFLIGFLWEVYEWSVWMILDAGLPHGYVFDTMHDLFMDILGIVSAYGITRSITRVSKNKTP